MIMGLKGHGGFAWSCVVLSENLTHHCSSLLYIPSSSDQTKLNCISTLNMYGVHDDLLMLITVLTLKLH